MAPAAQPADARLLLLRVRGRVQGVGFRPFVARLAATQALSGRVRNDADGVLVLACGSPLALERFRAELVSGGPPAAVVDAVEELELASGPEEFVSRAPGSGDGFVIVDSAVQGRPTGLPLSPDLALCPECRRDLADPANRRHGYPFVNCTQCGPRYTITHELPYDRRNTSMALFPMCPGCRAEYESPGDRRFHAEPNACPVCGPSLRLLDSRGGLLAGAAACVSTAARALRSGRILALKGLGGYHLMADACSDTVVAELRRRKQREAKPLAVMFPDLSSLREHCDPSPEELASLSSPEAPIVLVRLRSSGRLSLGIAPGNPWIGAMLPYTPLHELLCAAFAGPLVATSGNLAEEPLCITEAEALSRLSGIADLFLAHDRPIVRPVDDSVVRHSALGPVILRRARGLAPHTLTMPCASDEDDGALCLGGHTKVTLGLLSSGRLVVGPHIGDLSCAAALDAYRRARDLFVSLMRRHPARLVCDLHPDYGSSRVARASGLPVLAVQHHLAHVLSCLAEYPGVRGKVLGLAWDGTGLGMDGGIWGGEAIEVDLECRRAWRRVRLYPFQLQGGDSAARDARRSALCLLAALEGGPRIDVPGELRQMGLSAREASQLSGLLARRVNSVLCTSMGRLFDGMSALLGLGVQSAFEGQNAMALEFAAMRAPADAFQRPLPFGLLEDFEIPGGLLLDWRPALVEALASRNAEGPERLAARFHAGLAQACLAIARRLDAGQVALTGGCFQNRVLLEGCAKALREGGVQVLLHRDVPPNDGGLCVGQAMAACLGLSTLSS